MVRRLYSIFAVLLAFVIVGCGSVGKSIVAKQEWSENYARGEGVEATSPMMIDGSQSTIGEAQPPDDVASRGTTELSEAVVTMPEKKHIRRVVVYTPNIQSFTVYALADDGSTWELLEEIKDNKEKKIDMNVSAYTENIKVRVRQTSDDERIRRGRRWRVKHARGKIREIELYGLVTAEPPEAGAQPGTSGASGVPGFTGQKAEEKPVEPATLSLESPQTIHTAAGPIPMKINLKVGPDDLVVLADSVGDDMLCTKLLVKNAAGEKVPCAKPTPAVANPRPYRGAGRPVNVRDARTLEADSVITVDVPNLLEYYAINAPGNYSVQLDLELEHHDDYVGRYQSQIDDIERTIRDVNTKANYSQTERAAIISGLREDIEQLKKKKEQRYLVVGRKGKPVNVSSNILELIIQ